MKFSVDDRGNIANFFEKMEDGTWEKAALLNREVGKDANETVWENWSGDDMELWARKNGYGDEISESLTHNPHSENSKSL